MNEFDEVICAVRLVGYIKVNGPNGESQGQVGDWLIIMTSGDKHIVAGAVFQTVVKDVFYKGGKKCPLR